MSTEGKVKVPATYSVHDSAEVCGLMNYGANIPDAWHQVSVFAGCILKGAKPTDLPVLQSTKFEFVLNLQKARALGLEVPTALQLLADEVID